MSYEKSMGKRDETCVGEKSSFSFLSEMLWLGSWGKWKQVAHGGWRMTEWYWDRNEYGHVYIAIPWKQTCEYIASAIHLLQV